MICIDLGGLLDWVVHLFFLIESCLYEYPVSMIRNLHPMWIVLMCIFSCDIIKVNHYFHYNRFSFLDILSIVICILFLHNIDIRWPQLVFLFSPSVAVCTILPTFFVNALCNSLLNLCCDLSIALLFPWYFL